MSSNGTIWSRPFGGLDLAHSPTEPATVVLRIHANNGVIHTRGLTRHEAVTLAQALLAHYDELDGLPCSCECHDEQAAEATR